ncbi:MAG: hypothetical protein JEZ09_15530 [Salinivirgaceae bacterium]|nr:hypothetical protein [Salinivirgaceae bacterium]
MKIKLRINGKMLLYFLGTTVLVYIAALGYISIKLRNISSINAQKNISAISVEMANDAKRNFDTYMQAASTVANAFTHFEQFPEENRRQLYAEILKDLLEKNPNFLSVWSILESNSIDSFDKQYSNTVGSTILGNFRYKYYRQNDSIFLSEVIEQDSTEVFSGNIYNTVKNRAGEVVVEPYKYSYTNSKNDAILQTNMLAPIIKDNKFIGVVGVDAPLNQIQSYFSKIKPLETGKAYIITNQGNFLSHPDSSYLSKSFEDYASNIELTYNVSEKVSAGEHISFFATEPLTNTNSLFIFQPIHIGGCKDPWSFCISIPSETLYKSANDTFKSTLIIGILGLLIVSVVIALIAFSISKPLVKTTKNLKRLSVGNIKDVSTNKYLIRDEIADMADAMNNLVNGLTSAAKFAHEIGNGNLDAKYTLLSKDDLLGNSLLNMQHRLTVAKKEEEKKRKEDEKTNWVTHGLATFGEIIRQHNDNMEKFSMNVVENLVKYTNAAQIAIYINQQIEDDDFSEAGYELKAAMAYGKPIMMQKSFKSGEEMLGRSVNENKTIYLKEIPEKYVLLSPGMQDKKRPQYLLIIPICINNNSLGVFELLFYSEIENHYIEFIEKLSENIASVISSVKTNIRTANLLEQSQHQADALAQHEEEMRQNLEEMQATQEEALKRYNSLNSHLKAFNNTLMIAELDTTGRVIEMSPPMRVIYSGNTEKIKSVFFDSLSYHDSNTSESFEKFLNNVMANGMAKRMRVINRRNKTIWILETFKLIETEGMRPKIIVLAMEKTEEKEMSEQLNLL